MLNHRNVVALLLAFLLPVQLTTGCFTNRTVAQADRDEEYAVIDEGHLVRVYYENAEGKADQITGRVEAVTGDTLTVGERTVGFDRVKRIEILDRQMNVVATVGAAGAAFGIVFVVVTGALLIVLALGLRGLDAL